MTDAGGDGRAPESTVAGDVSLSAIPLHSTNLLTLLDADGVIRYESPAIERLYGYEQDELLGQQVAEYFHPADRADVVDAFRTVVESESSAVETAEYRHRRVDGSYCWVESVTSTDTTPAGHYVVNSRDVTARKRREKRLLAANERLDEFGRLLSHDLRTPLQVANGHLELATETGDAEHLDSVADAHDRMETLIEGMLTLARDGRADDPDPVDLAAVVEDCWRRVATDGATLVVETDSTVRAHHVQLRQLLENLLRNAVEHGSTSPDSQTRQDAVEHGSTSPRSQARGDGFNRGADGVTVTVGDLTDGFYVEDDGRGIDEDDRLNVFELGYTTASSGTGIGMRVVERVVEAHGWQIDIVDGPDGGTRFEITGVESPAP